MLMAKERKKNLIYGRLLCEREKNNKNQNGKTDINKPEGNGMDQRWLDGWQQIRKVG